MKKAGEDDCHDLFEGQATSALDSFFRMESFIPEKRQSYEASYLNLIRSRQSLHQVMADSTLTENSSLPDHDYNFDIRQAYKADLSASSAAQPSEPSKIHKPSHEEINADLEEIVLSEGVTADYFSLRESSLRVDNFVDDEISLASDYVPSGCHNTPHSHCSIDRNTAISLGQPSDTTDDDLISSDALLWMQDDANVHPTSSSMESLLDRQTIIDSIVKDECDSDTDNADYHSDMAVQSTVAVEMDGEERQLKGFPLSLPVSNMDIKCTTDKSCCGIRSNADIFLENYMHSIMRGESSCGRICPERYCQDSSEDKEWNFESEIETLGDEDRDYNGHSVQEEGNGIEEFSVDDINALPERARNVMEEMNGHQRSSYHHMSDGDDKIIYLEEEQCE